ncbi:MAG: DUF4880 domain-containing protein, partial [Xenophilus sp.]
MPATATPDASLLKEAADWAMVFQYDSPAEERYQAFERWRRQSPAHERAWARAQAVFHTFGQVPADLGKETLRSLERSQGRRRSLRLLSTLLVAAPAGWLAWR